MNGPSHAGAIGPPPVKVVPVVPKVDMESTPTGWRDLLIEKGPKEWAKAVREYEGLLLTDTTMYDQLSIALKLNILYFLADFVWLAGIHSSLRFPKFYLILQINNIIISSPCGQT